MTDELVSKQEAIDAIGTWDKFGVDERGRIVRWHEGLEPYVHLRDVLTAIVNLPAAQPEQQHGRVFKGIVVEYLSYNTYPEYKGKPYFLIKYTENGQEFIGYGTYKPEVLSEYLKEYFMPSAQPEIIYCKDCKHNPKESWFGCPMSHLSEEQRPETAWCWKGKRKDDERSD